MMRMIGLMVDDAPSDGDDDDYKYDDDDDYDFHLWAWHIRFYGKMFQWVGIYHSSRSLGP